MSSESSHISLHDKEVLNRLFNPNLPYGDVVDEDEDAPQVEGLSIIDLRMVKSY